MIGANLLEEGIMSENEITRRAALGVVGTAVASMAVGSASASVTEEDEALKTNALSNFKSKGIAIQPPKNANAYKILGEAGWYTEISRPSSGGVYDVEKPVSDSLVPADTKTVHTTMSYVVFWDKDGNLIETPLAVAGIVSTLYKTPTTNKWVHWVRAQFSNKADNVNWTVGVNFHFLFLS
jgi:hypothetical protein